MNPIKTIISKINEAHLWEDDITLERNELLVSPGSVDTSLYYIIDGTVRIYILDEDVEHIVRFGYQEDIIAALDSFMTDRPSSFYIQALKRTQIRKLSRSTFESFVKSSEELSLIWTSLLKAFVAQQIEREFDLLTASPVKRYQRVLARSPQLFQEVPHKYIASYLRMAPETLSRIKKS